MTAEILTLRSPRGIPAHDLHGTTGRADSTAQLLQLAYPQSNNPSRLQQNTLYPRARRHA